MVAYRAPLEEQGDVRELLVEQKEEKAEDRE
jgi:hypothetical protein